MKVFPGLTLAALVLETSHIGLRWAKTGHPPIFGTFEETLAAAFTILLFALILDRRGNLAHIALPIAAATMLYGLGFDTTHKTLTLFELSLWVDFHALFAWVSYGFYTFSFIAALCVLLGRDWRKDAGVAMYCWLLWGFVAQTTMYVLGAYYSILLHGWWWVWDAVEYLFVVSWLLYAVTIHGKILFGWNVRRCAVVVVLASVATFLLYWGLVFVPWTTYHIFDTDIVIHG
jgi:ABC-type transport system involved in cytochrome c biogenesis permease subunit